MKYNLKDELLWSRLIGRSGSDKINSMRVADDNNILIIGNTTDPETLDTDMLLLKISSQGKLLWANSYGNNGLDVGVDVIETENNFLIGGNIMSHKKGNMDISFVKSDIGGKTKCSSIIDKVSVKDVLVDRKDVKEKILAEEIIESTSQEGQIIELKVKSIKIEKTLTCN